MSSRLVKQQLASLQAEAAAPSSATGAARKKRKQRKQRKALAKAAAKPPAQDAKGVRARNLAYYKATAGGTQDTATAELMAQVRWGHASAAVVCCRSQGVVPAAGTAWCTLDRAKRLLAGACSRQTADSRGGRRLRRPLALHALQRIRAPGSLALCQPATPPGSADTRTHSGRAAGRPPPAGCCGPAQSDNSLAWLRGSEPQRARCAGCLALALQRRPGSCRGAGPHRVPRPHPRRLAMDPGDALASAGCLATRRALQLQGRAPALAAKPRAW